ncbi:hypothetical protein DSO57_1035740 [Entomophthora muscae]|uniref:Uncharacterized protein n=1 Tax=Entomophthora muscae TaxID=34485 RepID=A0ACC2U8U2_9FUNG|nr:hypothetical protein DSO57_1035740 [Entomophthora muscae]
MEAPPTPKPEHIPSSPGLVPPSIKQYASIAYITLAGLVNTTVPFTGPWSLVGRSASYLVKLAPLLWWVFPSSQKSKLVAETNGTPNRMCVRNSFSELANQVSSISHKKEVETVPNFFDLVDKGPTNFKDRD